MKNSEMHMFGHTFLRVALGLLFVLAGIKKFSNPEGVVDMLTQMSFFAPTFFAWVLILSEIVFGALVLVGLKVRYSVWPLVIVMIVAEIVAVVPKGGFWATSSLFHVVSIAGLVTIALTGPGKWAVTKD